MSELPSFHETTPSSGSPEADPPLHEVAEGTRLAEPTREPMVLVGSLAIWLIPLSVFGVFILGLAYLAASNAALAIAGGWWALLWLTGARTISWLWWRRRRGIGGYPAAWTLAVLGLLLLGFVLLFWTRFRRWLARMFTPWTLPPAAPQADTKLMAAAWIVLLAIVPVVVVWGPFVAVVAGFGLAEPRTLTEENCGDLAGKGIAVDRIEVGTVSVSLDREWLVAGCEFGPASDAIRLRHTTSRWHTNLLQVTLVESEQVPEVQGATYQDVLADLESTVDNERTKKSGRYRDLDLRVNLVTVEGRPCLHVSDMYEDTGVPWRPGEPFRQIDQTLTCLWPEEQHPGTLTTIFLSTRMPPESQPLTVEDMESRVLEIMRSVEFLPRGQ